MSVLGFVLAAASTVYVVPKLFGVGWKFAMTEVGRFMVTWVVIAILYDTLMRPEKSEAFKIKDAGITAALAGGTRLLMKNWG